MGQPARARSGHREHGAGEQSGGEDNVPFASYGGNAFTAVSVHKNAPPLPGVYGLSNAREWVYVGVTDDIRAALMRHLAQRTEALKMRAPTGFAFEVCQGSERAARQARLVEELVPVCNRNREAV